MTIVASSDLGALGAKNGPPVAYHWMVPSIAPLLLPWLAILGLLAMRPNRSAAAWLIWLPLGCVIALVFMPTTYLPSNTGVLLDAVGALALGLAAVWLLSNYLRRSHRFLTFLCVLLVLAGFSAFAFVSREGWSLLSSDTVMGGIVLAVGVLVTSAALGLGSLICRTRYRPLGLYPCLLLLLVVIWVLVAAPFFLFAVLVSSGRVPWSEFFIPILIISAVNFAILLPFLILSSASPFFRERLKALLNVKSEAPVPLNAPPLDGPLKT